MKKEVFIIVCTRIADFLGIELQEFITQLTTMLFDAFHVEVEDVAVKKSSIVSRQKILRDNMTTLLNSEEIYVITNEGVFTKILMDESKAFGFSLENLFNSGNISKVVVPGGTVRIEYRGFYHTRKIPAIILPPSIMEIGDWAFGSTDIKELTIPEEVTSISTGMCHLCDALEAVTLPEGITTIEAYAFKGCTSLKAINIPESVTTIEREAFANCPNLPGDVISRILEIGGEDAITETKKDSL